jgi:hypothetical protein
MPKVGTEEFGYSDREKIMAHAYAEKTGQEVEYTKGYAHGGSTGLVHTQSMTKQKDKYMPKGVRPAKGADPSYAGRGCGTRGMIGSTKRNIS